MQHIDIHIWVVFAYIAANVLGNFVGHGFPQSLTHSQNSKVKDHQSISQPCRNPRRCSSLAWHPSMPTQIAVAYEDDSHPVMQLWDLRSPTTFVHEYQSHHKVGADENNDTLLLGSGDGITVATFRMHSVLGVESSTAPVGCVQQVRAHQSDSLSDKRQPCTMKIPWGLSLRDHTKSTNSHYPSKGSRDPWHSNGPLMCRTCKLGWSVGTTFWRVM